MSENNEVFDKKINQLDKVEPVSKALSDMGAMWKYMTEKFDRDRVCYICKKHLEDHEEFDMVTVPDNKIDKGMCCWVCVCKKCNSD